MKKFNKIIQFFVKKYREYKKKKEFKRKIEELRKRDPFVYRNF